MRSCGATVRERGAAVLEDPIANEGTALSAAERRKRGLEAEPVDRMAAGR